MGIHSKGRNPFPAPCVLKSKFATLKPSRLSFLFILMGKEVLLKGWSNRITIPRSR